MSEAQSATIRVPEDMPTVLVAVDAAAQGDSVLVGPGNWMDKETRFVLEDGFPTEITACAFPRHGMTILGREGAENTILDARGEGSGFLRVITFYDPGPGKLVLEGLTITGMAGSVVGHGIRTQENDGILVRSCRFVGALDGVEEYPIQIYAGESEIISTEFSNNEYEGGIVSSIDASLLIQGCRFENNLGKCVQAESEFYFPGVVTIVECDFIRNRGRGYGVALDLGLIRNVEVRKNLFLENIAEEFSGAAVRIYSSNANVEFNVFAYDSCLGLGSGGAGLRWESTLGAAVSNTFVGCHGYADRAAVTIFGGSGITFERNVVALTTGSAAVSNTSGGFTSNHCNLYWGNVEGDFGNDWTPSPTDIFSDPLFCDVSERDFTVREDSPCIVGGCDQIGALGVGCKDVAVTPTSWGRIKNLYRDSR